MIAHISSELFLKQITTCTCIFVLSNRNCGANLDWGAEDTFFLLSLHNASFAVPD